jgi:Tol biopolymer transport system component
LVATPFDEFTPRLSPDGRWLAYSSDESGRREVYVRPFPNAGTTKWQVSTAGGAEPIWSRSGQELFYKSSGELVAAAVLPGATFGVGERQVLFSIAGYESHVAKRTYDLTPDGRRFVMVRLAATPRAELIVVENAFEELKAKVRR